MEATLGGDDDGGVGFDVNYRHETVMRDMVFSETAIGISA